MIPQTIVATADLVSNTSYVVKNETIALDIGVPQGAVKSPQMLNIFLSSLLEELEDVSIIGKAFADDLNCICIGEQ